MSTWIDPRSNPSPPYRGPARRLARDEAELAGLLAALKQGRFYDAEAWVREKRPLQADPQAHSPRRRHPTTLQFAIRAGQVDVVRLLLCNGYRTELEPDSPLNAVLEARRWDLLELLLGWGTDPHGADIRRILDTYQTAVFERFEAAGVDLTAGDDALADALAHSARNRPLYGFVRARRESDPRIQRALDAGLAAAIRAKNDTAVSLCLWAGANPRRRLGEIGEDPAEDADGPTALERAVSVDKPEYLKKLGLDAGSDDFEALYAYVHSLETLRALVAIRPPANWHRITMRFLDRLSFSLRLSIHMTSLWEVEQVFALGGRLGTPDPHEKRELRRLLLLLDDRAAQRLFTLLRRPERMDDPAFLDLIAHEKLAARWTSWSRHAGVDKALWAELVATPGLPAAVRRMVRAQLHPPRKVIAETCLEEAGEVRILSREQLYDLVWSEPLFSLAKRFGLSDNGLRKRCKAMNVPTPPRGYWQQPEPRRRKMRVRLPVLG